MWFLLSVAFAASDADTEYLAALAAWEEKSWDAALIHAEAALAVDPTHRPARLLRGYALLKLGRHEEAGGVLTALSAEPVTEAYEKEVRRRAHRAWRRYSDRFRRDQLAFSASLPIPAVFLQTVSGAATLLPGYAVDVDVPLPGPVDVRAEVAAPFGTDMVFRVDGARFGAYAVGRVPLGRSPWFADAALGPVVWAANGAYWPDGGQPLVGGHFGIGIDWRPTWRVGFRLQTSAWYFPALADAVGNYSVPVDSRLAMTLWVGK